jgi:hypothetical protein
MEAIMHAEHESAEARMAVARTLAADELRDESGWRDLIDDGFPVFPGSQICEPCERRDLARLLWLAYTHAPVDDVVSALGLIVDQCVERAAERELEYVE